jgi:hypothetical protein
VISGRAAEAQAAWLWKNVSPNATNDAFMREPLLAGDVWIALCCRHALALCFGEQLDRFR